MLTTHAVICLPSRVFPAVYHAPPPPGDAIDRAAVQRAEVTVLQGDGQRSLPAAAHELHPRDPSDQPGAAPPGQLPPVLPAAGEAEG